MTPAKSRIPIRITKLTGKVPAKACTGPPKSCHQSADSPTTSEACDQLPEPAQLSRTAAAASTDGALVKDDAHRTKMRGTARLVNKQAIKQGQPAGFGSRRQAGPGSEKADLRVRQPAMATAKLGNSAITGTTAAGKTAVSWKPCSEATLPPKAHKKSVRKTAHMETHKIHSVSVTQKPVRRHSPAVQVEPSSKVRCPLVDKTVPTSRSVSSLAEQQQELGIAFEADEGALNSILTCRGVTAPLMDRTVSLNLPASHQQHLQGQRKGGSAVGTRNSVYAACGPKSNIRNAIFDRKFTLDNPYQTERKDSPLPVTTPFKESKNKNLYKVTERNSVYVRYVTDEEWRSGISHKMTQPLSARLSTATPMRVRARLDMPLKERTPVANNPGGVIEETTPGCAAPKWRDIFTNTNEDCQCSCRTATRLGEDDLSRNAIQNDHIRRTLTYAEGDADVGRAEDPCDSVAEQVDAKGNGCMYRLSEADEELLSIEEVERHLQREIEEMEHKKMADMQRMTAVLEDAKLTEMLNSSTSGRTSSAASRALCDGASLAGLLMQLSLGSSPQALSDGTPLTQGQRMPPWPLHATSRSSGAASRASPTAFDLALLLSPNASPSCDLLSTLPSADVESCTALVTARFTESATTQLNAEATAAAVTQVVVFQQEPPCSVVRSAVAADRQGQVPDDTSPMSMDVDAGATCQLQHHHRVRVTEDSTSFSNSFHELLRSQSQLIATIDRLGSSSSSSSSGCCSNGAPLLAPCTLEQQGPQGRATAAGTLQRPLLTVTTASCGSECLCSTAIQSPFKDGSDRCAVAPRSPHRKQLRSSLPCDAAGSCCLLPSVVNEPDLLTPHTPVLRRRAGTISVLSSGIYSPLAADPAHDTSKLPYGVLAAACQPSVTDSTSSCAVEQSESLTMNECHVLTGEAWRISSQIVSSVVMCAASDAPLDAKPEAERCKVADHVGDNSTHTGLAPPAALSDCHALPPMTVPPYSASTHSESGTRQLLGCEKLDCVARVAADVSVGFCSSAVGMTSGASAAVATPMPLDLVQNCSTAPAAPLAAVTSAKMATPEVMCQLSLAGLIFNERFENALLDEECALHLCGAYLRHSTVAGHELLNPVAHSLVHGDDLHFIPIRDGDHGVTMSSPQAGSAFRCYTP